MIGNAVILKHSIQTPLVAERMVEAFLEAGMPPGVFQVAFFCHDASMSCHVMPCHVM